MKDLGPYLRARTAAALISAVAIAGFTLASCGGGGGYGGGGAAMVALTPQPFQLSSPANGATTGRTTPTLSWTDSLYASSYTVDVSTSNTFPTGSTVSSPSLPAGTLTWTVSPALAAATPYFWRVTAFNAYGLYRAGPRTFTTP